MEGEEKPSDQYGGATRQNSKHVAVSCWIEMPDGPDGYPVMCFDTESGETQTFELNPGAAVDLRDTVLEHGVVEPRQRYDHSGREPEDTEAADQVMREALGDDYDE